jgi:hypothetical protein
MRHILIAVAATAGSAAVVTAAAMAAGTPMRIPTTPPCTPKITKILGHRAAVNCGPATATLRIGGKSYVFRNGFCQVSKAAGAALKLDLGTVVVGLENNARLANFSMLIGARINSAFGNGSVFEAHYGGKSLLGGDSLISARGTIPSMGTFTSKVTGGAKFAGSWNCHGVVWHGP